MLTDEQVVKALVDQLYLQVRQLKQEPSLQQMKAVVDACRAIEDLAFQPIILKKASAIQVCNRRYQWTDSNKLGSQPIPREEEGGQL